VTGGRLAARLRAVSPRERGLLLLCVACVAIFVSLKWAVFPAMDRYRRDKAAIPARLALLARYDAAARGEDNVAESLASLVERLEELEEGLLPGDGSPATGVYLQGLLKPMIDRPDTRVTSVRALAPVSLGTYTEAAVQEDMQTTTEGLAEILAAVPRCGKLIRVRRYSVQAAYFGPSAVGRREMLSVSIVVAGLARAGDGAKPQGRGREVGE
jgi:hypothetical protein